MFGFSCFLCIRQTSHALLPTTVLENKKQLWETSVWLDEVISIKYLSFWIQTGFPCYNRQIVTQKNEILYMIYYYKCVCVGPKRCRSTLFVSMCFVMSLVLWLTGHLSRVNDKWTVLRIYVYIYISHSPLYTLMALLSSWELTIMHDGWMNITASY